MRARSLAALALAVLSSTVGSARADAIPPPGRRKLGDRQGAIEAAERALALDPTSAAAARMRSLA